jgi:hypothetical protein
MYPPFALTPCLLQGHRLSTRSSFDIQDNSQSYGREEKNSAIAW